MINAFNLDYTFCNRPLYFWMIGGFLFLIVIPVIIIEIVVYIKRRPTPKDLSGKVVLITGASSGLGEALAHEFYKQRCKLILCSRNEAELDRVRKALIEDHEDMKDVNIDPPVILPLDISDIDEVPSKADIALAFYGKIDILVNNAGVSHRGKILNTDMDVHQHIMIVNYFGHVAMTKAFLPDMLANGSGHILFVSSVQGLIGIPNRSAYVASKHALQGFCDSLRSEVAYSNIQVTVLSPGFIKTQLSMNALTGDGNIHGVMDSNIENGYDPAVVAQKAVHALRMDKKELVVATLAPRIAIFLRNFMPGLFFRAMETRAQANE